MAQPYDYRIQVADPFTASLEGYKTGLQMRAIEQKALQEQQQREAEIQRQQELQQRIQAIYGNPNATADDYEALAMLQPPDQAKVTLGMWESKDKKQQQGLLTFGGQVYSAVRAKQPEIAIQLLNDRAVAERNSGNEGQAKAYETWASLVEKSPDAAEASIATFLASVPGGKDVVGSVIDINKEARTAKEHPLLMAQKAAELKSAESKAEVDAINAKYAEKMAQANLKKLQQEGRASGDEVQSSKILEDGTVVVVTKSGRSKVLGADGSEITGQARAQAVENAALFGADIQGVRAGAREGGAGGAKVAQKAFETVGKVRTNIANLDAAIAALDAGANTGVIASKFPNWKASTIELKNIQNRLGLDVIGSVTFGALSEGELNLALETALPTNMSETELRKWLVNKKAAQGKLADYFTEQAKFLSKPGNNVGDWLDYIEEYKGEGGAPETVTVNGKTYSRPANFTDQQWKSYKQAVGAK